MLRRRFTVMAIVMAMIIAMLAPVQVSAASGDAPLVKSATSYYYDSETKKWTKDTLQTFIYNDKGYPIEFRTADYYSDEGYFHTLKYNKKMGSAPKSASYITGAGRKAQSWTYKKGLRTKISIKANPYNTYAKRTGTKKYTNKKKFVSKYQYNYKTKYSDGDEYTGGWGYSYSYKFKKGLPTYMTSKGLDEKGAANGSKYYVTYNKKGLMTKTYRINSDGTKTLTGSYSYKIKKGKVTQVISYYYSSDGKKNPSEKFVFKYTNTKVNKQRYANMINNLVYGTESAFGAYNWY